jgi:hypothetical protein
MNELSDEVHV